MNNLKCELISLHKKELASDVELAVLPTKEGDIGIMKDHMPMIFLLKEGVVRLVYSDKTERKFLVNRGFAEVVKDSLIILSDDIIDADDTDSLKKHSEESSSKFSKARISSLTSR